MCADECNIACAVADFLSDVEDIYVRAGLMQRVALVGGGASIPGMASRLESVSMETMLCC